MEKYKILTLVIASLFLTLPAAAAVTVTDSYISGSGIASGYHEGYYTHFSFENYCPLCGHHGTLEWNPKGTSEGEITCSFCDADFSVSGKDKWDGGPRAWLIKYTLPAAPISGYKNATAQPTPQNTELEALKEAINSDKNIGFLEEINDKKNR